MTDRAADDAVTISARLAEIQRTRMAAIAGCNCARDVFGEVSHTATCPLRPEAPPPCPLTAMLTTLGFHVVGADRTVADLLAAADEHLAKIGWRP